MFDSDICDPVTSMFNAYTTIRDMLLADGLFNMDIDDEVKYFRIWREHMTETPKNYEPIKFGSLQSKALINLRDIENNLPEQTTKYRSIEYRREQSDTDPDWWECECPIDKYPYTPSYVSRYCKVCDTHENEVADARKVDIAHTYSKQDIEYVYKESRKREQQAIVDGLVDSLNLSN